MHRSKNGMLLRAKANASSRDKCDAINAVAPAMGKVRKVGWPATLVWAVPASLFQIRLARRRTRMAVAARLAFRDSWGRLCIRRRKRKHRERQQNQCRRADESTHNRKYDRFRILHCNSPVCPNILRKLIPGRTDHNGMAAPGNVRIAGVYASRAAGGVTGISEITSKTGISLPRDNRRFGSSTAAPAMGPARQLDT